MNLGCDYVEISVNKSVRRKINRFGFFSVGDIQRLEHLLIYTIPFMQLCCSKSPS